MIIFISITVLAVVVRCMVKKIGQEKQSRAKEIRVQYTTDNDEYTRGM